MRKTKEDIKIQESGEFVCSPPQSCFECPYSDCIRAAYPILKEETKYTQCGFPSKSPSGEKTYPLHLKQGHGRYVTGRFW